MNRNEYMKVPIRFLPDNMQRRYNMSNIVTDDDFVYVLQS